MVQQQDNISVVGEQGEHHCFGGITSSFKMLYLQYVSKTSLRVRAADRFIYYIQILHYKLRFFSLHAYMGNHLMKKTLFGFIRSYNGLCL